MSFNEKTQKSHELFFIAAFICCSVAIFSIYIYFRYGFPVSHSLRLLLLDWNSQTRSSKMATSSYTFSSWRQAGEMILFRRDFSVFGRLRMWRKEVNWWAWICYCLMPRWRWFRASGIKKCTPAEHLLTVIEWQEATETSLWRYPKRFKPIPVEHFRFLNYDQLMVRANTNSDLPDIVGQVKRTRTTYREGDSEYNTWWLP